MYENAHAPEEGNSVEETECDLPQSLEKGSKKVNQIYEQFTCRHDYESNMPYYIKVWWAVKDALEGKCSSNEMKQRYPMVKGIDIDIIYENQDVRTSHESFKRISDELLERSLIRFQTSVDGLSTIALSLDPNLGFKKNVTMTPDESLFNEQRFFNGTLVCKFKECLDFGHHRWAQVYGEDVTVEDYHKFLAETHMILVQRELDDFEKEDPEEASSERPERESAIAA